MFCLQLYFEFFSVLHSLYFLIFIFIEVKLMKHKFNILVILLAI